MKSEMFQVTVEEFDDPSVGSYTRRLSITADLRKRITVAEARQAFHELHKAVDAVIQAFESSTDLMVKSVELVPGTVVTKLDGTGKRISADGIHIVVGL